MTSGLTFLFTQARYFSVTKANFASLKRQLTTVVTFIMSWQKVRTDVSEARSSSLTTSCVPSAPVCCRISRAASSALLVSRQAIITRPRSFTMPAAVAFPIPLLAPVTITVFPFIVSASLITYWAAVYRVLNFNCELTLASWLYNTERLHYPQFTTGDSCLCENS